MPVFDFRQKKKAATGAAFFLNFNRELGSHMLDLLVRMFVFVDLPAGPVLLPIEFVLLGLGQVTVVSSHIGFLLVLDFLFAILQTRSLTGRERAVLYAVCNAILLVRLAGIDFVDARMTRIDLTRSRAGGVAVLGLSSGGAN